MSNNTDDADFVYRCQEPSDNVCAVSCVGLEDCEECGCGIVPVDAAGPWGEVMDVIFCLLPIIVLIIVTVKPSPMETTRSLPLAAFLMFMVRLMYLGSDPLATAGAVILGLHEALTPLSIMAGAITLFETMEATKCLPFMMREMKALTAGHPIAELMLIFCFAYMVEGASGFGTPVALGAPMLVSNGHDPLDSIVVLLLMNTFATAFGAVGTPIWFGFNGLTDDEGFLEISFKSAVALSFTSFILMPFVLTVIVPWTMVKKNLVFIFLSLATVLGPVIGISLGSYEFPALMGGLVGCVGTAALIKMKIGLAEVDLEHVSGRSILHIGTVSETSVVKDYLNSQSGLNRSSINSVASDLSGVGAKESSMDAPPETTATNGDETLGETQNGERANDSVEEDVPKDDMNNKDDQELDRDTTNDDSSLIEATVPPSPSLRDTVDRELGPRKEFGEGFVKEVTMRTFPLWGVVILLILTRVEQIGIKPYLTKLEPNFAISFGTYGTFRLSVSVVFQLSNILTYPGLNWKFELLYLPFLMPFVLVSIMTMVIFRKDLTQGPKEIAGTVVTRLTNPAFALCGALCLVQLLIKVDTAAPAFILGNILSDWFKEAFIMISPLLGALGSFFSGSTTVSNLTFGNIQMIAAESIGTSETTMLALQAVGASAGNGICLNNIISACTVVGLDVGEGQILMRTYKLVLAHTTISTIVMLAFFFRF